MERGINPYTGEYIGPNPNPNPNENIMEESDDDDDDDDDKKLKKKIDKIVLTIVDNRDELLDPIEKIRTIIAENRNKKDKTTPEYIEGINKIKSGILS